MAGADTYIEPEDGWVDPDRYVAELPAAEPPAVRVGSFVIPQGPDYHKYVSHATPPPRQGQQVIAGAEVKPELDSYVEEARIDGRLVNPSSGLLPKG